MEQYFATKLVGLSPGGLTSKVHRFFGFSCICLFVGFCFVFCFLFFLGGEGGITRILQYM